MAVRVKICGLTNIADATCAAQAGADFLGFILYPKSPRYVSPHAVAAILAELKDAGFGTPGVGVFVNEPRAAIKAVMQQTGLAYAQLHGDEPPDFCRELSPVAYKALRPREAANAQADAARFHSVTHHEGPQLMLDAYDPTAYGGTGQLADQSIAATICRKFPQTLLAGGLTPDNVAEAVARVAPWGVDVSSGVESAPGTKDHAAVRRFIVAAQNAAPGPAPV